MEVQVCLQCLMFVVLYHVSRVKMSVIHVEYQPLWHVRNSWFTTDLERWKMHFSAQGNKFVYRNIVRVV